MVFTSHIFLFYFLPLTLLCYYGLPFRFRNAFLTLAAWVFYGWHKPWFVLLMMYSTVVDYTAARIISAPGASPRRRKGTLAVAITNNLLLLAVFKYAMFAQENVNALLQLFGQQGFRILEVTLPIGISFYTFQTISYTVDVYWGTAPPARRFGDFTCFVALFPHLIAGPIVRYNTIAEQFVHREHRIDRFSSGVALFMLGFAKKTLLANPMGRIVEATFGVDGLTPLLAWTGVLAYAFQIYFDFSGYSDIAVGLGRMLGFEIPRNFNSPYRSQSIAEFWQRWHISLSSFLRDYLYYPIGGNRHGPRRSYLNLVIVMLLGGLWHGASWKFVVWGAYHGVFLAVERWRGEVTGTRRDSALWSALPSPLRVLCTFVVVLLAWVPFRAGNMRLTGWHLGAMFGLRASLPQVGVLHGQIFTLHNLVLLGLCGLVVMWKTQAWDLARQVTAPKIVPLLLLFALAVAGMFTQAFNPFLYFQF
jgi:alginate O-acetyltransferase complex protein AlgI